eukprot:TRINITY_DN2135_c0_g1_i2.p3 TRINITY_DN2135_c0_g1~~TRINITY_DN2135_c0_g1_i2.p3  ORF type:complete len:158 (+),score=57.83 TRINITY_DN2135_c0_g1_i2:67-540(+)
MACFSRVAAALLAVVVAVAAGSATAAPHAAGREQLQLLQQHAKAAAAKQSQQLRSAAVEPHTPTTGAETGVVALHAKESAKQTPPAPSQGYDEHGESGEVSHMNEKTYTEDWGSEYGHAKAPAPPPPPPTPSAAQKGVVASGAIAVVAMLAAAAPAF